MTSHFLRRRARSDNAKLQLLAILASQNCAREQTTGRYFPRTTARGSKWGRVSLRAAEGGLLRAGCAYSRARVFLELRGGGAIVVFARLLEQVRL